MRVTQEKYGCAPPARSTSSVAAERQLQYRTAAAAQQQQRRRSIIYIYIYLVVYTGEESTNVNLVILSEPKTTKTFTGSRRVEGHV
jgi:hypothetical protein